VALYPRIEKEGGEESELDERRKKMGKERKATLRGVKKYLQQQSPKRERCCS